MSDNKIDEENEIVLPISCKTVRTIRTVLWKIAGIITLPLGILCFVVGISIGLSPVVYPAKYVILIPLGIFLGVIGYCIFPYTFICKAQEAAK